MKKQFFYAAFALSMMASCTNEDSPTLEQPTAPEEDKVAIELGIDSPTISAALSRGTGSVGDVDAAQNKWDGQRIYIAMVNNNGNEKGALATEKIGNTETTQPVLSWDSYEYRAPSNETSGLIKIYQKGTYENLNEDGNPITDEQTPVVDKGVKQYVYYPVGTGTYDFYGWHVDAEPSTDGNVPTNGTPNISTTAAKVENITIDGTQDIMGARTKEFIHSNYNTIDEGIFNTLLTGNWNFSARTARNGIKPILKFEHQLARLKFFVRAGSQNTLAKEGYTVEGDPTSSGAMFITNLSVLNMVNKITMDLNATVDEKKTIQTTSAQGENALVPFKLGSKIDGKVTPGVLTPIAPTQIYSANDQTYKGDPVGESIMFLPSENSENSIDISLALKQKVIISENEVTDVKTYDYKYQDTKVTVNANTISGGNGTKKFEAGYSYNIYITIYGFEQIEVTAELAAWKDGGDVDVDIEDGTSSNPEQGATETVTATFNISGLTEGTVASVELNNGQGVNSTAADENGNAIATITVNKGVAYTYTVSANGFENATGDLETTETAENFSEAVNMTATQQTPQTFTATFNVTLNNQPVENATITVSTEGCSVNGYTVTVPVGTEKITYSIAEGTNYEAVSATEVDVIADGTINVVLTEKTQD